LPPGIEGGIAELVDCKFAQHKDGEHKGKWFFYAAGVIKSPPQAPNGQKVEGLRTSIMEVLYDTPNRSRKTLDDHLAWVINEFQKLGVDTSGLTFKDLESVAAALKKQGPLFNFRTWIGEPTTDFPNPRVQEQWGGLFGGTVETSDDVEDNTKTKAKPKTKKPKVEVEAEPEVDLAAVAVTADAGDNEAALQVQAAAEEAGADFAEIETWVEVVALIQDGAGGEEAPFEADETEEDTEADGFEEHNYGDLGRTADNEEGAECESAMAILGEAATTAGLDPDDYESWEALGEALSTPDEEEEADVPEEDATDVDPPETGQVYQYKPKGARKEQECEITAVFAKSEKCNLKNLDNNKIYKSIPWGDLV
jgi:hypothetical protein